MKIHFTLSFQRAHFMEAINYFEKLSLKTDCIHIKPVLPYGKKMQGTGRQIGAGHGKQQSTDVQLRALAWRMS